MNENKIIKKVNLDEDWEEFVKNEGLLDYNKIPLKRAEIRGWIKIAFWFLRIYILIMVIMVIIGFSRIH
ncbi:MAG: hypothetical protein EVJ47_01465 [Candidatus Acidulodesulfobacterium ferriphilum]|jgi:hypothetical protein|uniref:Uncharacterized protein n=1 Tax=Candidatus Acidulodesulfobacterium ferriphilum TaxID=2597223 RepID=A0A519BCH4_9DELT|nr:hypothetical protein [Deltaproteobacteria bacterium]RZD14976.1 MAG: hypothetical protein EVJ47_01465 [Candidatus Acidulodesulfobacterium ferriphilum]